MMNPVIRDQWIADLESGEYTQGKNYLTSRTRDGVETNCCLGVLCQQAVKAGVIKRTDLIGETVYYGTSFDDERNGVLPEPVRVWAGLDSENPRFTVGDNRDFASSFNDNMGYTFPQIAALIRAQL